MYGDYVRVDSWFLFVFTSKEPWIQGGEDSIGHRAELTLSKDFPPFLPPFWLSSPAFPCFAAKYQTHWLAVRHGERARQTDGEEEKDRGL